MTVYFIGEKGTSCVKIGVCGDLDRDYPGDVEKRLRALQTANPRELRILLTIEGGTSMERRMHTLFSSKHLRGEWFLLGPDDLERAKNPEQYEHSLRIAKTQRWLEKELSRPYLEGYLSSGHPKEWETVGGYVR